MCVRNLAGEGADTLHKGIEFGMAEVEQAAQLTETLVVFHRVGNDLASSSIPANAPEVVACLDDDGHGARSGQDTGLRIYTCPLREWRPDVWSVASHAARTGLSVDWHPSLTQHGATHLNARFFQYAGVRMDEAAWRGWMAVKVAYESGVRTLAGEGDLLALQFDGYKGEPLRFAEDGHLVQPTYRFSANDRPTVVPPAVDADADEYWHG